MFGLDRVINYSTLTMLLYRAGLSNGTPSKIESCKEETIGETTDLALAW